MGIPNPDNHKSKTIIPLDKRILEALNILKVLPKEEIVFTYTNREEFEWCLAAQKYIKSVYPKANVTIDEWKEEQNA